MFFMYVTLSDYSYQEKNMRMYEPMSSLKSISVEQRQKVSRKSFDQIMSNEMSFIGLTRVFVFAIPQTKEVY